MFSTCVVDIFRDSALEGRHLVSTAEDGAALASDLLGRSPGLKADMYWVRAEDRSAAIAGKFIVRSTAFSFPTNRFKEAGARYELEDFLTKLRMKFALVVLEDAQRVEEHLGRDRTVTVYNNSAFWDEFSTIPDEDFTWANEEIRARETGRPPVPHPHAEIGFMVWLTYKANLMDGSTR
ncbi:hypothetical protein [Rhizobium ruizarguesonis]|jgi:hypothetical protein|uniref:hypothetical protein n=1 Tax=Rhizobium ruizarguesonis TaxID=2081791 RepID=UPI0010308BB8|nr:hypothetical protein [Rhizobium ruizarguesonis]TBA24708.1 hypothetical protein ELH61_02350 [Rhizobium ruizarguesonis]